VKPGNYTYARFHFEVSLRVNAPRTLCVRLFDVSAGMPVAGSQVCRMNPDPVNGLSLRVRTGPVDLKPGWREYAVQGKNDVPDENSGDVWDARIVVE
jgi:hypothetical protein